MYVISMSKLFTWLGKYLHTLAFITTVDIVLVYSDSIHYLCAMMLFAILCATNNLRRHFSLAKGFI